MIIIQIVIIPIKGSITWG